jgi:DNA-binding MarR family transcriptional regulator
MSNLKDQFRTCLYYSASAIARSLKKIADEQFQKFNLTPTQGFILMVLRKGPGASISVLGEVLSLDRTTISKTVERMELMGWLHRETLDKTIRIFLTDKGEALEADAKSSWKKTRLCYTRLIGEGEVQQLCSEIAMGQNRLDDFGAIPDR